MATWEAKGEVREGRDPREQSHNLPNQLLGREASVLQSQDRLVSSGPAVAWLSVSNNKLDMKSEAGALSPPVKLWQLPAPFIHTGL